MAFPGTYNINYYKGDTFEFRIFPKDANGAPFPLNNFTSAKFTIATTRGSSNLIEGYAVISQDNTSIECAITPAMSSQLLMSQSPYVYDVEIGRDSSPYDIIYTLLTGTIALTDQVTPLTDISPPQVVVNVPNNPTNLTHTVTNDSITIGWTEATTGDNPDEYNLYILPYTVDVGAITAALAGDPTDIIDAPATSYTFEGLDSETQYLVGVIASNSAGPASTLTALTNLGSPITTNPDLPDNPTDLVAAALSSSSIGAQWTAPEAGGTVEEYKIYIMEYTTDPVQIGIGYASGPVAEVDAATTQYLFTGLNPETGYLIAIRSSNVTGDAPLETALTNLLTGPITTPAEES
jgi:hypothetical protein